MFIFSGNVAFKKVVNELWGRCTDSQYKSFSPQRKIKLHPALVLGGNASDYRCQWFLKVVLCSLEALWKVLRLTVSWASVARWTVEVQAFISTLNVEAALRFTAAVSTGYTLINIWSTKTKHISVNHGLNDDFTFMFQ